MSCFKSTSDGPRRVHSVAGRSLFVQLCPPLNTAYLPFPSGGIYASNKVVKNCLKVVSTFEHRLPSPFHLATYANNKIVIKLSPPLNTAYLPSGGIFFLAAYYYIFLKSNKKLSPPLSTVYLPFPRVNLVAYANNENSNFIALLAAHVANLHSSVITGL